MRTKEELPECPVATAVSLIGGKWKLLLLRNLKERPWRFNELQRSIDGISQKVLTESLRQMIDDGLAYRRDYHENPPKVEYGLTDLGTTVTAWIISVFGFKVDIAAFALPLLAFGIPLLFSQKSIW